MLGRILLSPWGRVAGTVTILVAGLVGGGYPRSMPTGQTWSFTALSALAVYLVWPERDRLAWVAGFLLPIQTANGIPAMVPEAVSIATVGLLVVRYRPDLTGASRRTLDMFVWMLASVVALQLTFGFARDPFLSTAKFVVLGAVTLASAALVAQRVSAYRPILIGVLAGSTFSAAIALAQSAGWNLIHEAANGKNRYPGMALEAPGLAWHMVVALLIAAYVIVSAESTRVRVAAIGAMFLCALALIVCGAQGGLLGLAFAVVLSAALSWRQLDHRLLLRVLALSLVGGLATYGVANIAGFGTSSILGAAGDPDKGYENEIARARAVRYGVEQLADAPLTGVGVTEYDRRYSVRPHILPLNLSVNAGSLGLIVGSALLLLLSWTAIRGPADRRSAQAWLGTSILCALLPLACLTPSGPFARIERLTVLFLAVVMARGGTAEQERRRAEGEMAEPVTLRVVEWAGTEGRSSPGRADRSTPRSARS